MCYLNTPQQADATQQSASTDDETIYYGHVLFVIITIPVQDAGESVAGSCRDGTG